MCILSKCSLGISTYIKGYELRKLDRLDCPATNCKNSTTTYTTTIAN